MNCKNAGPDSAWHCSHGVCNVCAARETFVKLSRLQARMSQAGRAGVILIHRCVQTCWEMHQGTAALISARGMKCIKVWRCFGWCPHHMQSCCHSLLCTFTCPFWCCYTSKTGAVRVSLLEALMLDSTISGAILQSTPGAGEHHVKSTEVQLSFNVRVSAISCEMVRLDHFHLHSLHESTANHKVTEDILRCLNVRHNKQNVHHVGHFSRMCWEKEDLQDAGTEAVRSLFLQAVWLPFPPLPSANTNETGDNYQSL